MNKKEKPGMKKRMNILLLTVMVLLIIAVFTSLISIYIQNFTIALEDENSKYLAEVTEHITVNTEVFVNNMQKTMETAGIMLPNMQQDREGHSYLNRLKDKYGFEYVGFVKPDGNVISTMASEQKNIASEDFFQRAMKGESIVDYVPVKILENKVISGIRVSVPSYDLTKSAEDEVGVIIAMLDIKKLSKELDITEFKGKRHTYIIDKDGEIIVNTKQLDYSNLYMALGNTEFKEGYSLDKMISDLEKKQSGFAVYSTFGVEKYMQYQKTDVADWSVVSVVEKNIITEKTTKLTKQMIAVAIAIIIIFPILLLFAVFSMEISKSNKQAAKAKTAFLANMSHEIRTPMNAIVGISEILLREDITGKQKNYVLSILNAGNGLLAIINDILDISKIESGKFNIVEEDYELESLICDVVTIVAIKINDKPIELIVDLDSELPRYLKGDMLRVKQVLLNIIGNAVKFTHEGYIRLAIRAEIADEKVKLDMVVEDTGIGIQAKDLSKLFISFNQVDTHKNHTIEGTGLGLVISKRLCEMMGGDITVESEYGRGSVFSVNVLQTLTKEDKMMSIAEPETFDVLLLERSDLLREHFASCMDNLHIAYDACKDYETFRSKMETKVYTHAIAGAADIRRIREECGEDLPAALIVLLDLKERSLMENYKLTIIASLFTLQLSAILGNHMENMHMLKHGGIDTSAIQPMPFVKILIVDDNEVNLQVANGLMSPYHMQVDSALSARSAIAMLKKNSYDLLFMDHMMPEMDGVEAVRIIRELPEKEKSSVPIIALTANVTRDARALFIKEGFDDFLAKPIETIKLNELLKKWLRGKNEERASKNPMIPEQFNQKFVLEEKTEFAENYNKQLKRIPCINFEAGIERMRSCEMYCKVLKVYCNSGQEKMLSLPILLENDSERFTIEIHGLKGASASVCAESVTAMAAELEKLSKEKKVQQIREKIPEFLDVLKDTLKEIDLFMSKAEERNNEQKNIDKSDIL